MNDVVFSARMTGSSDESSSTYTVRNHFSVIKILLFCLCLRRRLETFAVVVTAVQKAARSCSFAASHLVNFVATTSTLLLPSQLQHAPYLLNSTSHCDSFQPPQSPWASSTAVRRLQMPTLRPQLAPTKESQAFSAAATSIQLTMAPRLGTLVRPLGSGSKRLVWIL